MVIILTILLVLVLGALAWYYFTTKDSKEPQQDPIKIDDNNQDPVKEDDNKQDPIKEDNNEYLAYRILKNSLSDFDIRFLQLENNKSNKVYSPLSIKYALGMLEEGTNGETKEQISNIIGTYDIKKYNNTKNMSFANALFIKDTYKSNIKDSYKNTLDDKYNAEIVYDSFKTPTKLNSWISDKTFKLINNLSDDISEEDFILVNALAIDMEWINKIQSEYDTYSVSYPHRQFFEFINSLEMGDYRAIDFKDYSKRAKAVEIAAVINQYDIVKTLDADNIRTNITKRYNDWLAEGAPEACEENIEDIESVDSYVNEYMKDIDTGYKDISSSTDFEFYVDDNVKLFAKDLKEYSGTTLQYIGIMPKKVSLESYINNMRATDVNTLISNLKSIKLENFEEGYITRITGYIPMFKMDYELKLVEDLNKLGITNIFTNKADLSNLTTDNAFINNASHKANIEFSNIGIKAAAVTEMSGEGAGECGFDYLYEVPVKEIDLTFDNPFMYIIRDKKTGEVWFTGTVYEPIEYTGTW